MKTYFHAQLLAASLLAVSAFSQAAPVEFSFDDMSHPKANEFLQQSFDALLNDHQKLEGSLADDFVQVFGATINSREDFLDHSKALQKSVASAKVHFEDVNVDEDGTISEIHTVAIRKKDGSEAVLRFLAFWSFKDGKLSKIDELSALIQGSSADKDIGARTK
ncbi:ketosteroid isomerase-like protein [Sinobacterium caligoides]|uniref:Ketosteroid isomerase-like protein n=1 Tax=Sinobacterium caligoides TaxID=933926 RepID=A0A3N2DQ80_9GAMM|nr:nuclear transport factor 2 family protein [Sinobacterium caligoides]ROS01769.1 ketosteroid isomerase-like protein [Sinobacterium caligoides]